MRTLGRLAEASSGKTKVVSEKLNSRAIACIWAVVRPRASGRTASALPANAEAVKTSTMWKRQLIGPRSQALAIMSISTQAPSGKAATPTAVRAGKGAVKWRA